MITFDPNILLGYYQSRNGGTGTTGAATTSGKPTTASGKYVPTAPWDVKSGYMRSDDLVKGALLGKRFIDEGAAKLDLAGASADYKKLFSLYQGLNTLGGLAAQASEKHVSTLQIGQYQRAFARGLAEVDAYADAMKLEQLRLTRGEVGLNAKTAIGVPKGKAEYLTATLHTGAAAAEVPAFQGDVAFTLSVKRLNTIHTIDVNLNDMTGPRTMSGVNAFINAKLEAEGLTTRFSVVRTPGVPKTITAGKTTTTLPAGPDTFAFKIKGDTTETLTFSAAAAKPAIYLSTVTGNPDPDRNKTTDDATLVNRLTKLNAETAATVGAGSKVFGNDLEGTITIVRSSAVGPGGSVYMLADVEKTVSGQMLKGESDVALLKYDSAGKLIYTRTLGASDTASGLALSIAADGKVAIAGSIKGELDGAVEGALNSDATSGKTDSFVTLYDAKGDELWTERRGAKQDDEATAVAFGADGSVYVAGRTKSTLPNGGVAIQGGWDSYLTAYATSAKGTPTTLFTKQFGSDKDDKISGLVVDGDKVVAAGSEGGRAVLRSFDVALTSVNTARTTDEFGAWSQTVTTMVDGVVTNSVVTSGNMAATGKASASNKTVTTGASATAEATRDLGDLQGGQIAGLVLSGGELYLGGSTRNAALNGGTPATAHSGGMDGFAMQLSSDLTSTASDSLAYVGGAGEDTVTGMAAADGKVWLTGSAGAGLGGDPIGTKDGYVSQLDLNAGAIDWTQRVTGKDGYATPTAIAVDTTGASSLDKFGLPTGTIDYTRSASLVSATSIRAGDTFSVITSEAGRPMTVTIAANETLESLAIKVRRATAYKAKVEVVPDGEFRRLKITPLTDAAVIEILPGKGDDEALTALGLPAGIARRTVVEDGKTQSADGKGPIYGLNLAKDLDLTTVEGRAKATAALSAALGVIRTAYRDLEALAKPQGPVNAVAANAAKAPAYMKAQVANYQAALDRLGG